MEAAAAVDAEALAAKQPALAKLRLVDDVVKQLAARRTRDSARGRGVARAGGKKKNGVRPSPPRPSFAPNTPPPPPSNTCSSCMAGC